MIERKSWAESHRVEHSARLLLSSRAKFRQDKLLRQRNDFALLFPGDRLWSPQGQQPLGLRKLPEVQLSKVQ